MANNIGRDLAIGKQGEIIAQQRLLELFELKTILNADFKNKHYDLISVEVQPEITFEVKFDIYANRSGNVAIEYLNTRTNLPSGISRTDATYWIHVLSENEVYICATSQLRHFVETAEPHRTIPSGGDNNAMLLLYRKEDIARECFVEISQFNMTT